MKDLIEKVAAEMPDAPQEEKLAAIAGLAMDRGFEAELQVAAGMAPPAEEKTAAATKKIAGRTVDFDKMTMDDVVNRLANRFGTGLNQAAIDAEEKTASAKPGVQKFAAYLKAELARPT